MDGNFEFELVALMESQKISYEQAFERLHRKRKQLALAQERQNAKKNKENKKSRKRSKKDIVEEINSD